MRSLHLILMMYPILLSSAVWSSMQVQIDEKTGRALGAREITPEELKKKLEAGTGLLIIDVRDPGEFEKETIKSAINIPLARLEERLKEIPKDTTLAFT